MNAASIEAYALEKGINFDWNTASQAEKSEVAMKMFMDRTSQYAGNFAKESTETFSGSLGAMKGAWADMMGAISTGEGVGDAMSKLGKTVATFAKNLMPMIGGILKELPNLIVTLLADAGPGLIDSGIKMIADLAKGLGESLPILIPKAIEAVMTIVEGLIDNIPLLVEGGLQLSIGLAEGLVLAIPALIEKIPIIITSLIDAIITSIPLIVNAGIQLITSLVQNLPAIIAGIVQALPQIITSIIDALVSNIPLIVQTGVQLLTSLITNLPAIIGQLVGAMPGIISGMVSALGSGISSFVDMGFQLLSGLATGIGNAIGGVISKAKEVAASVIAAVKGFFGINSPSRVFAEIGAGLDEGLANGITDNVKPITKAMDDVSALTQRSFASDIAFNATSPKSLQGLTASIGTGARAQTASTETNNNITINNPVPEPAGNSIRTAMLRLSYGV